MAAAAGVDLSPRRMKIEKSEGYGLWGTWRCWTKKRKKAPAARGGDPSTGQSEDRRDEPSTARDVAGGGSMEFSGDRREKLSETREEQRDGFSKIDGRSRRRIHSEVEARDVPTLGQTGGDDECESKQQDLCFGIG